MRSCSFLWWKVTPEDESISSNTSKWQKRRKRLSKSFCCFCWMKGKEIQYFWKWGTLKGTTCPSPTNYDASQTARTLNKGRLFPNSQDSNKGRRFPNSQGFNKGHFPNSQDFQLPSSRLPTSNSPYLTITSHFSHLITLTHIVSLHSGENILLRWQLDVPSADFLRHLCTKCPSGYEDSSACFFPLPGSLTLFRASLVPVVSAAQACRIHRVLFSTWVLLSVRFLHYTEGQSWLTRPWSSPLFGQLAFQAPQQNKWLPNLLFNVCHRLKRI